MNEEKPIHIITIEDPIEYLYPALQATINQREIGADTESFALALRAALRQAPKVILVGGSALLTSAVISVLPGIAEFVTTGHVTMHWSRATLASLLTPQYREYLTQVNYHEAVSNAPQWNASFCYPEGLMRWWSRSAVAADGYELLMTPHQVQLR